MTKLKAPTMTSSKGFRITGGKGFHLTFANGWTVSVQFGPGNYCDNRSPDFEDGARVGGEGCANAEVACWSGGGILVSLGSDTVAGWKTPDQVAELIRVVADRDRSDQELPADYLAYLNEQHNDAH